jgi:hypothetical protein
MAGNFSELSTSKLIMTCVGVAGLGALLTCFALPVPMKMANMSNQSLVARPAREFASQTQIQKQRKLWKFLTCKDTLLLTPYLICHGMLDRCRVFSQTLIGSSLGFNYGNFPIYIGQAFTVSNNYMPLSKSYISLNIAYAFLMYGSGALLGAFFWGRIYDRFKSRLYPILLGHVLLVAVNMPLLLFIILAPITKEKLVFPLLMLNGLLFGLTDFASNAVINNTLAYLYKDHEVAYGFSWYRFCFCLAFASHAAASASLPKVSAYSELGLIGFKRYGWLVMPAMNCIFVIIAVSCGFALQMRRDSKREKVTEPNPNEEITSI